MWVDLWGMGLVRRDAFVLLSGEVLLEGRCVHGSGADFSTRVCIASAPRCCGQRAWGWQAAAGSLVGGDAAGSKALVGISEL